jgi:hypothetical protein
MCQQCNFRGCSITPIVRTELGYFNFQGFDNANIFIFYNTTPRSRQPGFDSRREHSLFSSPSRPDRCSFAHSVYYPLGPFPWEQSGRSMNMNALYLHLGETCYLHLLCKNVVPSQLLYDWQFTANHFVLATSPLTQHSNFILQPLAIIVLM